MSPWSTGEVPGMQRPGCSLFPFCHSHFPGHLQDDPVVDLISLGPDGGGKKLG